MNILKRVLLQQITLKSDVVQSVYQLQRLHVHNSHHGINLFNSLKATSIGSFTSNQNIFWNNQTIRKYSSQPVQTNSLVTKFVGLFKNSKSILQGKSVLIYGQAIDTLDYDYFVKKFEMPNTFNSWFLITEIHVWMLMVRAMAEKEHGQLIRNGIVTALWTDVLTRTKEMAPGSMRLIKKQVEELSQQFQYAIVSYDEALTTDDKIMASAVWNRFFGSNCDNYEHIELLVKYIRHNIAKLDKLDTDDFLTKRTINWSSLKDIEKH